ncbi:MAG: hypothetical protein NC489_36725 [Ruminococcus flavefaciens]|nr:hypothetical protein [Ruminococcus flavefaciens]
MKVLGTNTFLYGDLLDKMHDRGYSGVHNQFRIICKCKGIANANRKCKEIGLHNKIFTSNFTTETGNKIELELCEKEDVWFSINGTNISDGYISAKELLGL